MPELIEHLLPFLDLASTKELAGAHRRTRQILGTALNWDKMIKRTFPASENNNMIMRNQLMEENDDPILASERQKVRGCAQILRLALLEDSDGPQLEMNLLHTICGRYPNPHPVFERVKLNCSCLQTHQVSSWGFVLLEETQSVLESREQSVLEVERFSLHEPLLTAVSSMVSRQHEVVKELTFGKVKCKNKESAMAFAKLVVQCQAVKPADFNHWIFIEGEIGINGWAALRSAVERLSTTFGRRVDVESQRKVMTAGRREDLRAIWDNVSGWHVKFDDQSGLVFNKNLVGEQGGWEGVEGGRRGLSHVMDMSDTQMLEEIARVKELESSSEEEEFSSEEGEDQEDVLTDEGDFGPE